MNLDDIEFDVNVIDNFFYYKMFETNKIDNDCNEIREIIIVMIESLSQAVTFLLAGREGVGEAKTFPY